MGRLCSCIVFCFCFWHFCCFLGQTSPTVLWYPCAVVASSASSIQNITLEKSSYIRRIWNISVLDEKYVLSWIVSWRPRGGDASDPEATFLNLLHPPHDSSPRASIHSPLASSRTYVLCYCQSFHVLIPQHSPKPYPSASNHYKPIKPKEIRFRTHGGVAYLPGPDGVTLRRIGFITLGDYVDR